MFYAVTSCNLVVKVWPEFCTRKLGGSRNFMTWRGNGHIEFNRQTCIPTQLKRQDAARSFVMTECGGVDSRLPVSSLQAAISTHTLPSPDIPNSHFSRLKHFTLIFLLFGELLFLLFLWQCCQLCLVCLWLAMQWGLKWEDWRQEKMPPFNAAIVSSFTHYS